ncbi:Cna B-type domain-containing protein [Peptostreptococcus stomatis]
MKKHRSILLALVMVFNVLVSGLGNNLSYADDNEAFTQGVSANRTLNGSGKVSDNSKKQKAQKDKNTGLDKKSVDKKIEEPKKKDLDKKSAEKKVEDPKKKEVDKKSVEGKPGDSKKKEEPNKKELEKKSTDGKNKNPIKNGGQDSDQKKLGKTKEDVEEKTKENSSLEKDNKEKLPETKEEKLESKRIFSEKQDKGLIVKVDAPEGAFPTGTSVYINLMSKLKGKISYDITFKDKNNKEIQPAKGTEVKVSFILDKTSSLLPDDKPVNLKLYHVVNGVPKVIDTNRTAKGFMEEKGIQSVTLSGKVSHFSEFRLVAENDLDFDKIKDLIRDTGEVAGNVITEARVTDGEGNPFKPGQQVGAYQGFRIYAKFKLPDNVVKEGDTTTMTLPMGIDTAPPDEFQIKDGDKVIANAKMYNQNPAKIVLTYTKYAEEHSGVQGEFYFNVSVNPTTQPGTGQIPVTLRVNGKIIPAGHVDYNPPHFVNSQFTKGGWMTSDKTVGKYDIRINQDNVVLVNAKFEDTIQSENVSFIQGSLKILNGKWENHGSYVILGGQKDVTQEFRNAGKVKFDGKKLTINIGNYPESNEKRGFQILYEVKLGYEPLAGEEIKNKASLTYGSEIFNKDGNYKIKDAGGTGEGYVYKIQVLKTGENSTPLAGAKFDVIRVRNSQTVGTITTDSNGKAEIGKLLRDDYKLVETQAPEGYQKLTDPIEVKPDDFGTKKIALKNIENKKKEKTKISVRKEWVGGIGNSITAQVKMVGSEAVVQEYVLNAANNWQHTFENLEKYAADGSEIQYRVVEKDVPAGYKVEYEKDSNGTWVIKNTKEKITVKVTKKWEKADGTPLMGDRPTIRLQLLKDGQPEGNPVEFTNGKITHEWTNLDKTDEHGSNHIYTVKEVGENGYNIQLDGNWYKVTYGADLQNGLTVTNKKKTPWTPMEPPFRDLKVTKVWKDKDNNDLVGPVEKIEVELYKDGVATGTKLDLTKANNWTGEFKKLPVSATLDGPIHKYTVKETGESGNAIQFVGKWYGVTYGGKMKDGLTVTNKEKTPWTPMIPPTRDLKVTKVWKDKDNNDLNAPVEKIEVELYKDGAATGTKLDLTKANNWTGEFKKLPVSATLGGPIHKYTVKETGESGNAIQFGGKWYGVTYGGTMKDGLTVTNREKTPWTPMIPPTRDLKVTKVWKGKDNNNLVGPVEKIEVELYKDGVATGKKLDLTKANNWTGTFEKLDVADGLGSTNYYKYTVKEVGESGAAIQLLGKWYGVTYGGTMKDGLTVTNKEKTPWTPMEPPFRNIKVEKNWNLLGREKPVEKLEVELYRDGVATGNKLELNKDNNWSGEFKKLPVAEKLGSTNYYNYTVKEVGENAGSIIFGGMQFSVNYTGDMKDGFKITNNYTPPYTPWTPPTVDKIDLKVTKLWKDSKDNNIAEPTNKIVVELYREGKATGKKLELNKANKWSGEFTDLEAKSDSDEYYRYTIKEVGENGNIIKFDGKQYKVIYGGSMRDGITITNKKEDPPKPPTPNKPTPNKPTPNKPTPPKPNTPNPRPVLPRTGDGINPSTIAWLILVLGAGLSLIGYRLRKHRK